jgi:hypothetical protein
MRENDGELALLYAALERAVLDAVCCFASQSKSERDTHIYNKRCARAWLFLSLRSTSQIQSLSPWYGSVNT